MIINNLITHKLEYICTDADLKHEEEYKELPKGFSEIKTGEYTCVFLANKIENIFTLLNVKRGGKNVVTIWEEEKLLFVCYDQDELKKEESPPEEKSGFLKFMTNNQIFIHICIILIFVIITIMFIIADVLINYRRC